jgi:hypothetical protein
MLPRPQSSRPDGHSHLTEVDTQRYARGRADEDEKNAVERHITACADCLLKLRLALRYSA